MKHLVKLFFILFTVCIVTAQNQPSFDEFFTNKTLRIDYYRTGDAKSELTTLDKMYKYGEWAGSKTNLISPFRNGRNRISIYDHTTNQLIFQKTYDNYLGEYQVSEPAINGIKKTYFEITLIPCPKRSFTFVLEERDKQYIYHPRFQLKIDPNDYHIHTNIPAPKNEVFEIVKNGNHSNKVDLTFVGDGYTEKEKEKFKADLKKYTDVLFGIEPFKSHKDKFNVRGVFSPSIDSGVDEPRQGIYKNTVLNSTFNSLDSDRYLMTEDVKTLYDLCSVVPTDAVVIMCNIDRYGGGGIYNFYATFTASTKSDDVVFLHEFGHSFGGLADEYYTSDVAYDEFYPKGIEPAEANITALLDKDNVKWKKHLTPGLPVPTPWGKEIFDSLSAAPGKLYAEREQKIKELKSKNASETEIKKIRDEYSAKMASIAPAMDKFLVEHPMKGKIGVFEGAGYSSKGMYRPTINSIMHMFKKDYRTFDKVSEEAIINVIKYFAE